MGALRTALAPCLARGKLFTKQGGIIYFGIVERSYENGAEPPTEDFKLSAALPSDTRNPPDVDLSPLLNRRRVLAVPSVLTG